jgi:hypothetical protein
MTIAEIIVAVKEDLAAKLPPLLEQAGAPDLSRYAVGYPDTQNESFCCVRLAAVKGKEDFEFIIHLALPGVSEAASYVYIEAAREYLDGSFEPYLYGYDTFNWDLQVFETEFEHGDIQALISVTMSRQLDDCC